MNQEQRRTYSGKYKNQIKRLEGRYLRRIYNALRSQVDKFISDLENRGQSQAISSLYTTITNDGIAETLNELYGDAGLFFARKTYREIQATVRQGNKAGFGSDAEWVRLIIAYLREDFFSLVSGISNTTREQILDVMTTAQNEGWSIDQITYRLRSPELLVWRAQLIVRTELAKASFVGRKLVREDSDWETNTEWIAANDHRTRHGHKLVDGEVIPVGGKFQVTRPKGGVDMMEGPGDPTASIENLANCRCSEATVAARDERGRLIPKKKNTVHVFGPDIRVNN